MIYVASPYSHPKAEMRANRYQGVLRYCAQRLLLGEPVFSPIVYGHHLVQLQPTLGTAHDDWRTINENMIAISIEVRVLKLPGWDASSGIADEITYVQDRAIPVKYVGALK